MPINRRLTAALIVPMLAMSVSGCGINSVPTAEENAKAKWANVQADYERRANLIPNLVETVKGYMKHERETLEAVIQARNSAVTGLSAAKANPGDPQAMQQLAGAENALGQTLSCLMFWLAFRSG